MKIRKIPEDCKWNNSNYISGDFMKSHQYVTIGCSHTRVKFLRSTDRWPYIVQEKTGALFEFRHMSRIASGLVHLECRCHDYLSEFRHNVDFLVIQKPQPIRFPWWKKEWRQKGWKGSINRSGYGHPDLVRGRTASIKAFATLSSKKQNQIADLIYEEELECLIRLKEFFPKTTKIAYYHYWADAMMEIVHRPPLSYINTKLGEEMEKIGIENWDIIVDPHEIPGVYDGDDLIMDTEEIHRQGWICLPNDLHAGPKYAKLVADKVINWMARTNLPSPGDNSLI